MSHPTDDRNYRLPSNPRPTRYDVRLVIDPEKRTFRGKGTISLQVDSPIDEIVLHAADLRFHEVRLSVDGVLREIGKIDPVTVSETVRFVLDEPARPGACRLHLKWEGSMSSGLRGLYQAGAVSVTQFEAADARRVFPCFDEPAFKAPWSIELVAPSGSTLLSNGQAIEVTEQGCRQSVRFKETPPLPTYLVALVCGRLAPTRVEAVRGVPVRTWAVPEKARLAAFAQEVALEVLPRLEDYFGMPYGFGKLDQVGIPEFEAGAMENAGLITFRETALLLDPETASMAVKKRVAEVVTHELAHQWFGNWVTMRWWDDLWLNESFATWMAYKIVDGWRPEWRVWLDFDAGKAAALNLDALRSTHPIRAEVRNPEEMTESFDLITYEKGGAVLRMIEGFLGEEPFRDGIRLYMKRHAKGSAVADDLWRALAEESRQPVVELANAWIERPGHPLIDVSREGRRVGFSQRRLFSAPSEGETETGTWPVPLVLKFRDSTGIRLQRHVLRGPTEELDLEATGEVSWLCANGGSTGFYRVAYGEAELAALASALGELAPSEKIGLLADEWALVRAGRREVTSFLELAAAFGRETDYAVLDELVGRLAGIEARILHPERRAGFQRFVAALLGPGFADVGWDAAPDEADSVRLRRAALVRALGLVARDPAIIDEGSLRLERMMGGQRNALEPNLHDAAVAMAARGGDSRLFELLRSRFKTETDPAAQRRYLVGLALFEDGSLSDRARALAFGEEIPLQDLAFYMTALLGNRVAREPFWRRLREQWASVQTRIGGAPMLLRRVLEAVGQLPERRNLEEAEAFFEAHPIPVATQAVAQTLERMRQDVALWEKIEPAVGGWLERRP